MITQIFEAIVGGIKVGFHAFFSVLPIYQQLSDLKTEITATAIGVPVAVVTLIGIAIVILKVIKFLKKAD